MVGGNMRQAGPLAAAGIVALENMVARLPEDHRTAKRLAVGLNKIDASIVDPALIETNLVRASVRACARTAAEMSKMLAEKGVRVSPGAGPELRFVTHRHIGDAEVDKALGAFAEAWKSK
jgi:threonine aldolase